MDGLKTLKVEDMEATRPEDKAEILAAISDKEAFDVLTHLTMCLRWLPWESS